ncbi:MAG: DUF1080 domain-containing protein [Planctomycetes bacterium]|nr:DUF1080 domain-containing protein [Planctomycetota bacterium]MCH9723763.1 DUF1080 domain-containing protein [Planctomycetota bacterium]MCH9776075.1 DUF1080 domain-containing protein [Planctomycetota bacterium]MCH9789816.1 DUF1080 domain-containing protein [Planctomycetota bacterium]
MRFLLLISAALLAFTGQSTAGENKRLFPIDASIPVVNLFPADSLREYSIYSRNRRGNKDPNQVFKLKDRFLRGTGNEVLFLMTKQKFRNYHLIAEYKWLNNKTPRDSGIFVNTVGKGRGLTALECNLFDPTTKAREFLLWGSGPKQITINGKKLLKGGTPPVNGTKAKKPMGQWNRVEIICDRDRFFFSINGRTIVVGTNPVPRSGAIMFQHNKGDIQFGRVQLIDYDALNNRDATTARALQKKYFND